MMRVFRNRRRRLIRRPFRLSILLSRKHLNYFYLILFRMLCELWQIWNCLLVNLEEQRLQVYYANTVSVRFLFLKILKVIVRVPSNFA